MSKYQNICPPGQIVESRNQHPEEYHCNCHLCQKDKFIAEIYSNSTDKFYSNRARRGYYIDTPNGHLDRGQMIGYRWAIQNYSKPGDLVFDPTVGSGTAIVEAITNDRRGMGIELEYPKDCLDNVNAQNPGPDQVLFKHGDAKKMKSYFKEWGIEKDSIDLILNGTPYPKLGSISSDAPERKNLKGGNHSFTYEHDSNLGNLKTGGEWEELISTLYRDSIEYLKPGGCLIVIIKDPTNNKKPYLLHRDIADLILSDNMDVNYEGYFLHRHVPTTLFMNTYPKKFPGIKIPIHQVGMVFRKDS